MLALSIVFIGLVYKIYFSINDFIEAMNNIIKITSILNFVNHFMSVVVARGGFLQGRATFILITID